MEVRVGMVRPAEPGALVEPAEWAITGAMTKLATVATVAMAAMVVMAVPAAVARGAPRTPSTKTTSPLQLSSE